MAYAVTRPAYSTTKTTTTVTQGHRRRVRADLPGAAARSSPEVCMVSIVWHGNPAQAARAPRAGRAWQDGHGKLLMSRGAGWPSSDGACGRWPGSSRTHPEDRWGR